MPTRKVEKRSDRVEATSTKIEKSSEHRQEEIALRALEYVNKKRTISILDKDCKEIRVSLESFMDKNEVELPTGSKECLIPYVDVEIHLKRSMRNSVTLSDKAMDIIKELGIEKDVVETKSVINEEALKNLITMGIVSEADALRLFDRKVTYAFSVDTSDKFDEDYE